VIGPLQKCLTGSYGLGLTFWLVFVLPFIVLQLIWPLYITSLGALIVFSVAFVAWLLFAGVSVWRSAAVYRVKYIGYLARAAIVVYSLGSVYALSGDLVFYARKFT